MAAIERNRNDPSAISHPPCRFIYRRSSQLQA